VTLDLDAARRSMDAILSRETRCVCPGHREPLTEGAEAACREMRGHLARGGAWPLLG
jgi:hypothetical protein